MSVKFKLNRAGVRELMRSQAMVGELETYARRVKDAAGEGFEMSRHIGKNRANVGVIAETPKARAKNIKYNLLLKALGRAKG